MRFVKPLDLNALKEIFSKYKYLVTVEDGCLQGGFGSAILEAASEMNFDGRIKRLGIPDEIIEHGSQEELYALCGYDVEGIMQAVKSFFAHKQHLVI
jgi:1-deoxy-D-xylulose-5-phosphate synthase